VKKFLNSENQKKIDGGILLALYLLIPFCGFYTVKLGLSPVYFTFIFGSVLVVISAVRGIRCGPSICLIIANIAILAYICVMAMIGWELEESFPFLSSASINLAFSLSYLLVATLVVENIPKIHLVRASEMLLIVSIALLTAEAIDRYLNPTIPENWVTIRGDIEWKMYKTSSFMYPDSNYVGLYTACLIGFIFCLESLHLNRFSKYLFPLFILLIATLSRAAIIAVFVVWLHRSFSGSVEKKAGLLIAVLLVMLIGFSVILEDDSFLSKFWIFDLTVDYFVKSDPWKIFFGVGPGGSVKHIGIGSHLLLVTFLIEIGVIGAFLNLFLLFLLWRQIGKSATPVFAILFIVGLSFTSLAIPWFYCMVSVIKVISRDNKYGSSLFPVGRGGLTGGG
jgi:hypothetical protein